MKVLLINPPGTVYGSGLLRPSIPLGLICLSAFLKKNNIECVFFDALAEGRDRKVKNKIGGVRFGLSEKIILNKINKLKPDYIGIGTMFTAYEDDVVELSTLIKSKFKKVKIIVGGSHVSVDPAAILRKCKDIDYAVFGEGEKTLLDIVKGVENQLIDGLVYRENNRIIRNKPRELIKSLDDLPLPDYKSLKIDKYDLGGSFNMRMPVFPITTSRGCPGHCLYCSVNAVWNHCWRGMSAIKVVDEIEYLINNFGAKEIAFQDDSVSVNKARMKEICQEIIDRKINIKWTTPNGIAHWTLDKDLLVLMKRAGCYRITFGIETGDEEMRRWVGKPYSLNQARDLTRFANKLGLWTLATNIIGFPYENRKSIDKTFDFALKSDVDLAFFFRLGPRPGTKIFEIFEKEGWLMDDRHLLFSEDVACRNKYFTGEEIIAIQQELYRKFILKRWISMTSIIRLINKIKSWEDLRYMWRLAVSGIKLSLGLMSTRIAVTSKNLRV